MPSHRRLERREGDIAVTRAATPRPAEGELLVRVLRATVCGTDLDILRGARPDAASVLGHEGVGLVVQRGPGTPAWPGEGTRVVFNPVNPSAQDEILGHSTEGVFQELRIVTARERAAGLLVPVPDEVPTAVAPLAEPLSAVVYAHRLASARARLRKVLVLGCGGVGALHVLHAAEESGAEVTVLARSPDRGRGLLERGLAWGCRVVPDGPGSLAQIARHALPGGFDAAFVCTARAGAARALDVAMGAVRDGGVVVLTAAVPAGEGIDDRLAAELHAVRRDNVCGLGEPRFVTRTTRDGRAVHVTGHRGSSRAHVEAALQCLGRSPGAFGAVISEVHPLEGAPRRLLELRDGVHKGALKVAIDLSPAGHAA